MSAVSKEQVVEFLENMTLIQASELVKELEDKFGVSAAAPMMVAGGAAGAPAAAEEEEKDEFLVELTSIGDKKIEVIKEVRKITGLGLKEAKDLVEGAPKPIKDSVNKEEANKIKEAIEKTGAKVTLK